MSSSHEGVPDHGSALTAELFVCPFAPRFFHHIHLTRVCSLRQRLAQQGIGGSVVDFSLTRRKARVRFPAVRQFSSIWIRKNVNDTCQKSLSYIRPDKRVLFLYYSYV